MAVARAPLAAKVGICVRIQRRARPYKCSTNPADILGSFWVFPFSRVTA